MKIAILTPTFSPFSGIDRLVEQEAAEYSDKGHKVSIFCFRAEMRSDHADVVELGMPKVPFFERLYRLFFFLDFLKVKKFTKMLKGYDVVVSHLYPMNIIAQRAKRFYGSKYIYYNAGVAYPWLFDSPLERLYMRIFNHFSNRSINGADSIISISKFLRDQLKREIGLDSRVKYIRVDKTRFRNKSPDIIRKKYKLGNRYVFLYVGRISPHKGVHLLLKAFKMIRKEVPATLLIVGKHTFPGYSKFLYKIASNDVIFAGFVPDEELPYYYAACDVYVTCSLWEGFDIPIIEAEAAGKPSVAFGIGSHSEVLKKGVLVKENDLEGFKNAVVRLIKKK